MIAPSRWLAQAAALAERGFSIIALDHPAHTTVADPKQVGKVPLASWKAFQQAKPSADNLRAWFGGTAPANPAIVTGAISGVVVVDGDNEAALEWMRRNLPETPMRTRTAKGEHWFYRHPGVHVPNQARIRTKSNVLAIDVRGDGGYVVAPGALHASGVIYEAIGDWPPVADLPAFDVAWVSVDERALPRVVSPLERARAYVAAVPGAIEGQGGDAHTFKLACRLVRGLALDDGDALEVLLEWNRRCAPPWTERELAAKVESAHKNGREAVGGLLGAPRAAPRREQADSKAPRQSTAPVFATGKQGPYSNLQNVNAAFEADEALRTLVWYDEFLDRFQTAYDGKEREWTDADDVRWCIYLQDTYALKSVTPLQVRAVVDHLGRTHPRNVAKRWLRELQWDGEPRLELAFEDYWGVTCDAEQPCDYVRAASRNFLIGLVARILRPGCQLDTMPVFEGPQGIFKSRALRVLAGADWHVTAHETVGTKDFLQVFPGKWIVEIAELDAFSRVEVTRVKSVMSTPVDRYRPSYGRSARDYPRQCVFAGTTNVDNWGRDETGLRRFWPVKCGLIDLELLEAARPQLLAEAVARFEAGASWWDMPTSTHDVQASRQHESPLLDPLATWLLTQPEPITIYAAIHDGLKIDAGRIGPGLEKEVGRSLRALGWIGKPRRDVTDPNKKLRRMWHPPGWIG